ncbi:MAG: leucine-rich repeat protein [Bacilli bacterium]|nr:leucine-rich repeat protein [Bacilli bacterium]
MKIREIELESLKDLGKKELNEIRRKAIVDNPLIELPSILLPEVHSLSYYFVSYSHDDYKEVYLDIIGLEEAGLEIWYDRGIPAGKSWRSVAEDYLYPRECKGVILYLGLASLTSDAVLEEIRFAKEYGKPLFVITLPVKEDYLYKDKSTYGKSYSLKEMIEIAKGNGLAMPKPRERELLRNIKEEDIFLPYIMHPSLKKEKIESFTFDEPLFRYREVEEKTDRLRIKISGCNDPKIKVISLSDLPKSKQKEVFGYDFLSASFSNFAFLEGIRVRQHKQIRIGDFAFYGCLRNRFIDVDSLTYVGRNAFMGNLNLRKVVANDLPDVSDSAFAYCEKLSSFEGESVYRVGERAFFSCVKLKEFKGYPKEIGDSAFAYCESLSLLPLSKSTISIGSDAFKFNKRIETVDLDLSSSFLILSSSAFSMMEGLKSARLKTGEKGLPERLFYGCHQLEEVHLNCIEPLDIGPYAFSGDLRLRKIEIEGEVTSIGKRAFVGARHLDTLLSSDSGVLDLKGVTHVGFNAFFGTGIRKVVVYGKEGLEESCFGGMSELEEIDVISLEIYEDELLPLLGDLREREKPLVIATLRRASKWRRKNSGGEKLVAYVRTVHGETLEVYQ